MDFFRCLRAARPGEIPTKNQRVRNRQYSGIPGGFFIANQRSPDSRNEQSRTKLEHASNYLSGEYSAYITPAIWWPVLPRSKAHGARIEQPRDPS